MTYEEIVQNGVILILGGHVLPEGTKVLVTLKSTTASSADTDLPHEGETPGEKSCDSP